MLSQDMMEALRFELEKHEGSCHEIPLCLYLTVVAACYVTDSEFNEELWDESRIFLTDEILMSCILKGAVEVAGINEDGEMTFQATEHGLSQVEELKKREEDDGR